MPAHQKSPTHRNIFCLEFRLCQMHTHSYGKVHLNRSFWYVRSFCPFARLHSFCAFINVAPYTTGVQETGQSDIHIQRNTHTHSTLHITSHNAFGRRRRWWWCGDHVIVYIFTPWPCASFACLPYSIQINILHILHHIIIAVDVGNYSYSLVFCAIPFHLFCWRSNVMYVGLFFFSVSNTREKNRFHVSVRVGVIDRWWFSIFFLSVFLL